MNLELLRTIYTDQTDEEIQLIVEWCKNKNLDPANKPCFIKRENGKAKLIPTLNGYIAIAQNSGMLGGISEPKYGPDDQSCTVAVTRHSPISKDNGGGITFEEYTASPVYFADYASTADHLKYPRMYLANWALSKSLKLAFADLIGGLPTDVELNSAISFSDKHTSNIQPTTVPAELPVSTTIQATPVLGGSNGNGSKSGFSIDLDALLTAVDKKTTPPVVPLNTAGIYKESNINIQDLLSSLPTTQLTLTRETYKKTIPIADNRQLSNKDHGADLNNLIGDTSGTDDLDLDAIFAD